MVDLVLLDLPRMYLQLEKNKKSDPRVAFFFVVFECLLGVYVFYCFLLCFLMIRLIL